MDYDIFCAHGPVAITFAFSAVDEAIASVQVNIALSYLTSTEKFDWSIYEVWVPYRSLAQFESALDTNEAATLASHRGQCLVRVTEDAATSYIEAGSGLSAEALHPETMVLQIATRPGLKRSLERAFAQYAKWW